MCTDINAAPDVQIGGGEVIVEIEDLLAGVVLQFEEQGSLCFQFRAAERMPMRRDGRVLFRKAKLGQVTRIRTVNIAWRRGFMAT